MGFLLMKKAGRHIIGVNKNIYQVFRNITTLPFFAINHFSKFHLTSEPCFGSQRQLFDGQNSSHGAGHIFCIAKTTKF